MKARLPLACTLLGLGLILACGGGTGTGQDAGAGLITTFAGGAVAGAVDAAGQSARFNNPVSIVIGPDGNFYVADFDNNRVRRLAADGSTTTVINQADFVRPFGMAFIGNRLFVETDGNDTGGIDGTTGTIWEVDIVANTASVVARNLGRPRGLVGLPNGHLAMSNLTTNVIETMDVDTGVVTPLAGSGTAGFANGTGAAAMFNRPYGMDLLNSNTLLVADSDNNRIRSINLTTGAVGTYAGSGVAGSQNGFLQQARFNKPQTVQVLNSDNIFVGDNGNFMFRHISLGSVAIFAGTGTAGFMDGALNEAQFYGMEGFDVAANGFNFYVADGDAGQGGQPYHRIRRISFEAN
jgi:sugar lactone lactonase YvrE